MRHNTFRVDTRDTLNITVFADNVTITDNGALVFSAVVTPKHKEELIHVFAPGYWVSVKLIKVDEAEGSE